MRAHRGLLLLLLLGPTAALAYWAETHEVLNKLAFQKGKWPSFTRAGQQVENADQYLSRVLFLNDGQYRMLKGVPFAPGKCVNDLCVYPRADLPTDEPIETHSAMRWLARGGLWEDGFRSYEEATKWGGLRAVNHFQVPVGARSASGGYSGLTTNAKNVATHVAYVDLLRSGIPAPSWAMGANSGGDDNHWSWVAVGESMVRFYTEEKVERRESGLAAALRSAGQVMHLIEDNTVPDHARDLAHPGDGYEEYVKDHLDVPMDLDPNEWTTYPHKYIEQKGIVAFWDRDVYSTSPGVTLSLTEPPGISEFTQANFLAWNVKNAGPVPVHFTTVPYTWEVGFGTFPWPRYFPPNGSSGYYGASVPGTYPLAKLMRFEADPTVYQPNDVNAPTLESTSNIIDDKCWKDYAPPLLRHALGYAQSVVPMMLQQARAEVVPDPAEPMTRAKVRLWNLAPGDSPYAVTWRVDEVQLLALNVPKEAGAPANAPISVTFPSDTVVPPGMMAESQSFTITAKQRGLLSAASYSVVIVKAHLGDTTKLPLTFGVPIPNAFPVVRQLELVDLTMPATVTTICDTNGCGDESVVVSVRQPFDQALRLSVELFAPEVDLLGAPADSRVKEAAAADARLAGLAVGSWIPTSTGLPDFAAPRWPASEVFSTSPANLSPTNTGRLFRLEDAKDMPTQGAVPLELTLHLSEFIQKDSEALAASESTHLAIWTTSGGLFLVRLVLWPLFGNQTAVRIATDFACDVPGDTVAPWISVGGCLSPASRPQCDMSPSKQYSYGKVTAPWSGVGGFVVGTDFTAAAVAGTNTLKIDSIGGMPVTSGFLGGIEPVCSPSTLSTWMQTTQTLACNPGPGGVLYSSTYTEGGPYCPSTPQKMVALSATLKPRWQYPDKDFWENTFGRKDQLPDFTLTAH